MTSVYDLLEQKDLLNGEVQSEGCGLEGSILLGWNGSVWNMVFSFVSEMPTLVNKLGEYIREDILKLPVLLKKICLFALILY